MPPAIPAERTGPRYGPMVYLGLPCALEVATLYVLIAVQTPLTPAVDSLMANPPGMFVLAAGSMVIVSLVMCFFYSMTFRAQLARNEATRGHQTGPFA